MKSKAVINVLRLVGIHKVHHRNFGYGFVFMPLMLGYFSDFKKMFSHISKTSAWHFVERKEFHDCTTTGIH